MNAPRRVIAYVDGFNFYHALKDPRPPKFKKFAKHLRWLDYGELARNLLRPGEQLIATKYFSAFATWLPNAYAVHRDYVAALQASGVECILGQFKKKERSCKKCGASWIAHEEKESDVNIAIHLVSDAMQAAMDRAILITADSDLVPAVRMVRKLCPNVEVFVATPPAMLGHARDLSPALEVTQGRISRSLLPAKIVTSDGTTIVRPAKYDPPA